eukprot:835728-Lingulodinium_polyedra.AAC.1
MVSYIDKLDRGICPFTSAQRVDNINEFTAKTRDNLVWYAQHVKDEVSTFGVPAVKLHLADCKAKLADNTLLFSDMKVCNAFLFWLPAEDGQQVTELNDQCTKSVTLSMINKSTEKSPAKKTEEDNVAKGKLPSEDFSFDVFG